MKTMLAVFLPICLASIHLHSEDKEKQEDKSYLDNLKKLYDEKVESGKKLLGEKVESGKEATSNTKNWVKGDIENIGDWEYKIVAFGKKAPTELEKELNQLGNERWQCFWVEATGKDKVFYFKRTKMSYIQKIPAGDLLRIIGLLDQE